MTFDLLISNWGTPASWARDGVEQPHEANLLKLDCSKAQAKLGWVPKWDLETAIKKITQWHKSFQKNEIKFMEFNVF